MGQLVANLALAAGAAEVNGIWEVGDEQLLEAARRLIHRNRGRGAVDVEPFAAPEPGGVKAFPVSSLTEPPRQVS